MRQVLIPLWNSYVFLATYAKIYSWKPQEAKNFSPKADIDRWILSLTMKLQKEIEEGMNVYELQKAVEPLVGFIDQLTNWYIRRSRARFWADEDTQDRREAFQTLYQVLLCLVKMASPFIPFLTEAIYLELKEEKMPMSVHLLNFPSYNADWRDEGLEREMALAQNVVSSAHALRKEHKLKVRQPLRGAHIVAADKAVLSILERQKQLIADELNVKDVVFHSDEQQFVKLKGKANFRILGKKVGAKMNEAKQLIENLKRKELEVFLKGLNLEVSLGGEPFVLTPEDISIEREALPGLVASSSGEITVALDTTLDEALLLEGLAREIVNKINTSRRDQGYAVTDRVTVQLKPTPKLKACFELHRDYIVKEVLASSFTFNETSVGEEVDLNGEMSVLQMAVL
jgi:isoleucyl-tRNA synthetase